MSLREGHDAAATTDGATPPEARKARAYLDDMVRRRGYVLEYHKLMAAADPDVLAAEDQLVQKVYLAPRLLDARTKELLVILSLTVMRAPKERIRTHVRAALDLGLTPTEVLEAIEIALPEAGVVAFQWGVEAWADVVDAPMLEPSADALAPTNSAS